jgi:hypothetical protein
VKGIPAFDMQLVERDAIHRANFAALWLIKVTHTFGTLAGLDLIDFDTLIDGTVRTLRLTDVTVDTLVGNL